MWKADMINDNLCRDHNHTQVLQEIYFLLDIIYIYIMYKYTVCIYVFIWDNYTRAGHAILFNSCLCLQYVTECNNL